MKKASRVLSSRQCLLLAKTRFNEIKHPHADTESSVSKKKLFRMMGFKATKRNKRDLDRLDSKRLADLTIDMHRILPELTKKGLKVIAHPCFFDYTSVIANDLISLLIIVALAITIGVSIGTHDYSHGLIVLTVIIACEAINLLTEIFHIRKLTKNVNHALHKINK